MEKPKMGAEETTPKGPLDLNYEGDEKDVKKRIEFLYQKADEAIELIKSTLLKGGFSKERSRELKDSYDIKEGNSYYSSDWGDLVKAGEISVRILEQKFAAAQTEEALEDLYYQLVRSLEERKKDLKIAISDIEEGLDLMKNGPNAMAMAGIQAISEAAGIYEDNLSFLLDFVNQKLAEAKE